MVYAKVDEQIIFCPFEHNREERFLLEVILVEEMPDEEIEFEQNDKFLIIKFYRKWDGGMESSATNIEIISDDSTEAVMLRFSCEYIGSRDQHLTKLSYNIIQAEVDGSDIQA